MLFPAVLQVSADTKYGCSVKVGGSLKELVIKMAEQGKYSIQGYRGQCQMFPTRLTLVLCFRILTSLKH